MNFVPPSLTSSKVNNNIWGERMARFLVRKLGAAGDTCVAVAEKELAGRLQPELEGGYSVALRTEETAQFVGSDLELVMAAVRGEVARGVEELEVLLIPRVEGG